MNTSPEHVEVAVVGSGFGGSVAAYRLAEAGREVVLLERGAPYAPGSFPRTPADMKRAFWDPSEGLGGMFDVWSFGGFSSVVSSGLGGGSLIYANVLLRKDERWFVHHDPLPGGGYETWPLTRADLDPHYDAVEAMLTPTPYPFGEPAFSDTPKTRAMVDAAGRLGLDVMLPPLAVTFAPGRDRPPAIGLPLEPGPYPNLHGRPRFTCRLCGECDIGCNAGAKNTLDHTYLSAAAAKGADLRTRCEVRSLRPVDGGYELRYVRHTERPTGRRTATRELPEHVLTARKVVLAAGTLGTSFLLLRNRAALPGLGPALGTRFSGNGDLLAFLLRDPAAGHDATPPPRLEASRGPVITAAVRVPDAHDGDGATGRGYYVEDGGYPGFVDWLAESADLFGSAVRGTEFALRWLWALATRRPLGNLSSGVSRLLSDGALAAGSLPLLGMGRDVPDGIVRLRNGRLDIDWTTRTSQRYLAGVRQTMRDLSGELGTVFVDNPVWIFKRVVTVHPLGGAPMGTSPAHGVCDSHGEVFGHPGLYVLDGSAMPGPVGANPSLTIAAFADRACTRMLDEPASRTVAGGVPRPAGRSRRREPKEA